jgi:hypothetical protein
MRTFLTVASARLKTFLPLFFSGHLCKNAPRRMNCIAQLSRQKLEERPNHVQIFEEQNDAQGVRLSGAAGLPGS